MIFDQNFAKQGTMEKGNKREWWTARLHYISAHVFMDTDTTWKWKIEGMTSRDSYNSRGEAQRYCRQKIEAMISLMTNEVES